MHGAVHTVPIVPAHALIRVLVHRHVHTTPDPVPAVLDPDQNTHDHDPTLILGRALALAQCLARVTVEAISHTHGHVRARAPARLHPIGKGVGVPIRIAVPGVVPQGHRVARVPTLARHHVRRLLVAGAGANILVIVRSVLNGTTRYASFTDSFDRL
ncbi:unnamed protein product [Echinostoma caproni]|uniref:Secreted protein n=1 Tax=Echinostoma caproni TaxID=27848 RepID=A0A182ZZJ4_9TREM|nr:unnamed protein product [Echinostoma caproni]